MQTGAPGDNCWQESYQILSRWKSFNSKEVMSHSEWGKSSLLLKKAPDKKRSTWRQLLARKLSNFVKMEEF